MTKDELLLRVSTILPKNIVDELKCDTLDEMIAILPEVLGREMVKQLKEAGLED